MRILIAATLLALLGACSRAPQPAGSLEGLRDQWVVVNYWAKWCKPCIEEIPELNRLDAEHDDISVLGVNYDGLTGEDLATQERELGVQFPTIVDPAAQLGTPRPVVLPTSVLLAPGGEVHATLIGPQTRESLLAAIRGERQ
jgi:thiol-disulfide isomerase/thioredoxin